MLLEDIVSKAFFSARNLSILSSKDQVLLRRYSTNSHFRSKPLKKIVMIPSKAEIILVSTFRRKTARKWRGLMNSFKWVDSRTSFCLANRAALRGF